MDTGGRVERTGIALVHEGEYIGPAPGSEAAVTRGDTAVHYHFPVEIEVVGTLDAAVVADVVARVFTELERELGEHR